MKNLMRHLTGLAMAIAAAAGCAKLETGIRDFVPGEGTFTVVFTSQATKTGMERVQVGENAYEYKSFWTKGDSIGVFVRCGQSEVNNNLMSSKVGSDTLHRMEFRVSGITAPAADTRYDFYAYYPYSGLLGSDYRNVRVMVPVVQYPAHGSFDPKADVLSGYPTYRDVKAGTQAKTLDVELAFARRSSVVVLMPQVGSGLPDGVTSESPVGEIQLTFSKPVAGVASLDIIDTMAFAIEDIGGSRTVTLKYADGSHKLGDPIWVSVAPVREVDRLSFAFKIDDGRYLCADADWSVRPQTFKQGKVKKYNVPINSTYFRQKQEVREYYQLVDTPQADWCGRYLIVGESGGQHYACNQTKEGDWGRFAEVSVTEGKIACSDQLRPFEFEIVPGLAQGRYSILDSQRQYLSAGAATYNTVAGPVADNTDMIVGPGSIFRAKDGSTRQFRFSPGNGMKFYDKASVNPVALYRLKSSITYPPVQIGDVPDQEVGYQAGDAHSFDVTILNVEYVEPGMEPSVTVDGTVVTSADIALKAGDVYTVTYSVGANGGLWQRSVYLTVNCGGKSKAVRVTQDVNEYGIRLYDRVKSLSDIKPGRYVILASTATITSCLPSSKTTKTELPQVCTAGFEVDNRKNETRMADSSLKEWDFSGSSSQMLIDNGAGDFLYNADKNDGTHINNVEDYWTIRTHTVAQANDVFEFQSNNHNRFLGIYNNQDWRSYETVDAQNYSTATGSSKLMLFRMPYYCISFLVSANGGDSSTKIDADTQVSNVVSFGKAYISGFTAGCNNAYLKSASGVKIGTNSSNGTLGIVISDSGKGPVKTIVVKSVRYGTDNGTLSLYVNDDAESLGAIVPGQEYVHTFETAREITGLRFVTSSKRAYLSEIILDPR